MDTCRAGGVFEEAIAEAALLLGDGCKIVETVRGGGAVVDAAFWAGRLPPEARAGRAARAERVMKMCITKTCCASAAALH
jgi:hypothetical protein